MEIFAKPKSGQQQQQQHYTFFLWNNNNTTLSSNLCFIIINFDMEKLMYFWLPFSLD